MLSTLIDVLVKVAAGVAASLLVAYTPSLIRHIRARVKNATAREALAFITAIISAEVAARAERVRELKDPSKPEVGAWTPEAAKRELLGVIDAVKAAAPEQVAMLRSGLAQGQSVEAVLRTMTEAQVEHLRRVPVLTPGAGTPAAAVAVTNVVISPEAPASDPEVVLPRPTVAPPAPIAPGSSR